MMTYREFKAMILEDEDEPMTVDGEHFDTVREMEWYIKDLYRLYKEGN